MNAKVDYDESGEVILFEGVVRDITGFVAERDLWVSINVVGVAATIGHTQNILEAAGLCMEPVAKVNLGLGRKQ